VRSKCAHTGPGPVWGGDDGTYSADPLVDASEGYYRIAAHRDAAINDRARETEPVTGPAKYPQAFLDIGWMNEAKVEVCNYVGRANTEEDLASNRDSQSGVVVDCDARGPNLLFVDVRDSVHCRWPIDLATPQPTLGDLTFNFRGDATRIWA